MDETNMLNYLNALMIFNIKVFLFGTFYGQFVQNYIMLNYKINYFQQLRELSNRKTPEIQNL